MISDEDAEKAVDYLRDSASQTAQARADRIHAEEYRKSMLAIIMSHQPEGPANKQEKAAYSSNEYVAHLTKIREAVFQDELLRARREAALAKINAWQTFQATMRAARI